MGERTIPEIVGQYIAAGAPCLSVVTGRWFGGDDEMLREVAGLTDLPLLKKDFITREKQIVAAKEMGASAILLTAKILPSKTFQHLIELALGHGLTPFVEVVDQAELDSVIHPEDCIIAVNNKDINTREREPGDIDTSRSLLEATIQAGTPCPVSASAITRPADRRRAGRLGLQGPSDRDRAAPRGQHRRAGSRSSSATAPSWKPGAVTPSVSMSQTATRSIADHFAEQAQRQPEAPALIWDGAADLLRRAPRAGRRLVRRARGRAAPRGPAGRDPGEEVARGDRAGPRLPARAARVPAALDRARGRDARPAVRPGRVQPGPLPPRPAQRERRQPARAGRRRPRARGRGAGAESEWPPAGGTDDITFMLTTSGSTGLPKIVPLTAAGVDAFTDWAAEQFEIGPGTVVANYAPLNFDLCLLDIWTTLKHGGCVALVDQDRATQGAYLADLVADNQVNVLQAVPMLYRLLIDVNREDGRTFPSVRHVITTGDKIPASSLAELPEAVPQRPVLQRLRLHRDQRQPHARVPRARRRQRPGEHPRWPADARRDRQGPGRGRHGARGHRHRRADGVDAVPDARLPERGPERGEVRHARGRRRPHLLQDRRHRPPPRGRHAHARGPRRLLRQGARRAGVDAGRRAGDPGASRGDRGGGHRRARRARRRPPARHVRREADAQAQQPAAPPALRDQAGPHRDAFDDSRS